MATFAQRFPKLYAALKTALVTFAGLFLMTAVGFIGDVAKWADGSSAVFPSLDPLGKGIVFAAMSAVIGLMSFALNWLQENGFPGSPARYPSSTGTPLPPPPPPPPAG